MQYLVRAAFGAAALMGASAVLAGEYEDGVASGVKPSSASEMLECAMFWDAWADSLNPDHYGPGKGIWDPSWIAKQNPAIQLPAARTTAEYWLGKAKSAHAKAKKSADFEQRVKDGHGYDVEALNERFFMKKMGECARP